MTIEVRPIRMPSRLGVPEAAELEAYATLGFSLERANWDHDHFAETAAELLAMHRNDAHRGRMLFGAWDGETLVGRSGLGWERDAEAETVELTLGVLPSHRRQGVTLRAPDGDAARPARAGEQPHGQRARR